MFKHLFTVSAFCAALMGNAQIQNSSFESWSTTTTPDGWDTSNSETPSTSVLQGEPGNMSAHAALLVPSYDGNAYPAILHQTVPITEAPENVQFYWSGDIASTDTLYAIASALDGLGNLVGVSLGIYTGVSASNFQMEVSPFIYFAEPTVAFVDLAFFYVSYSDAPNAGVLVDDVAFTGVVAGVSTTTSAPTFWSIDEGRLRFSTPDQGAAVASIYGINGQLIDRWNVVNTQAMNERDIAALSPGVYVFQCGGSRLKFVKQ